MSVSVVAWLGLAASTAFADPTVTSSGKMFLRSSFDADASPFVGRFIPDGAKAVDETAAMPTVCSQFITYRQVDGGNVKYSELMEVSDSVALKLGALVGNLKIGADRRTVTRVDYQLTGKLVAVIDDPAGMQRCCAEQPGQCTERYVGSILQGKGSIYREKATGASGGGSGVHPTTTVTGAVEFSHGTSWEQAITFEQPVYFAFELTENPYRRITQAGSCGAWVDRVPQAPGGRFLVGASKPSKTEEKAKKRALRNAWRQAAISAGAMVYNPEDFEAMQAAQQQGMLAASKVEPREWCVVKTSSQKYVAHVLSWLPQ